MHSTVYHLQMLVQQQNPQQQLKIVGRASILWSIMNTSGAVWGGGYTTEFSDNK